MFMLLLFLLADLALKSHGGGQFDSTCCFSKNLIFREGSMPYVFVIFIII